MAQRSGGGHVVAGLRAHGVDTVFGIPGTHNLPVYAGLRAAGIRHVLPRHEQGAGFAADGYARATGRAGVALVTSGPAVTNAATAMAQAHSDSVPLLLLSPGMPTEHPGLPIGALHEAKDQRAAMDALVAYSHRVTSLEEIPRALAHAFSSLSSGRPRPVHVEVPLDLLAATGEAAETVPVLTEPPAPPDAAVGAAARLLAGSARPGIVLGGGARGAGAPLLRLARALGAPMITTANGKGVVAEEDPLAFGAGLHLDAGQRFLRDCDAVLAVGTELAEADHWRDRLALPGALVRVDIDPAMAHANAPADVALIGDAARVLDRLAAALPDTTLPGGGAHGDHPRAAEARAAVRAEAASAAQPWAGVLEGLRAGLPEDAVVTGDSAMVCYRGAVGALPVGDRGRFLYPTGYGTLGYALPAAVGARVGCPERAVCALMGDGGFQFTAPELASAVQLGLPLPIVVVDNGGYGEIRAEMREAGIDPFAVDLPPVDLPALARAYGARGTALGASDDLADALADALGQALAADGPTLIAIAAS